MAHFVARYDFRAPGAEPSERQEIFARAIDQAAYLDQHGHDALMVSEHHAAEDGYLPSPLLVASAFAAVTTRIPISVSALLVNLYETPRLAEDIAVLDHVSRGRVSYTLGLGYREEEYALFDRAWATRGRDIERRIEDLLRLWRDGEVTPAPFTQPHPFLSYGGGTPAAAKRAARLGLGFQPQDADVALRDLYNDECRAHGREPGIAILAPPGPANIFCAEDPETFWGKYGHHLLADAQSYQSWRGASAKSYVRDDSQTVEQMQDKGIYVVLTPADLIEQCQSKAIRLVTSHPACGGLPAEPSWDSVRLISETVIPALRAG
jgi:alkanesulfonate monooxygenase SsuD/methylene tetrahydromethanopterin reductase-like flavin-dependent oxidoreductase (luciferase family)